MAGCNEDWYEGVSAWHDGEVSAEDARRIEAHVLECAACRHASALLGEVGGALRGAADATVPEHVVRRAEAVARPRRARRRWVLPAGVAIAAALAAVVVSAPRGELPSAMADELVGHHVRGFARERPCDFESSDPEAVAAWISGEVGYNVKVEVPAGAELLGARACRLGGMRTAALLLRRDGVPLTLFVPRDGSPAAQDAERLARGSAHCVSGALGNTICAGDGAQPLFAVAEQDPQDLERALQMAR